MVKATIEFVPDFGILEHSDSADTKPDTSWDVKVKGKKLLCEGTETSKS